MRRGRREGQSCESHMAGLSTKDNLRQMGPHGCDGLVCGGARMREER